MLSHETGNICRLIKAAEPSAAPVKWYWYNTAGIPVMQESSLSSQDLPSIKITVRQTALILKIGHSLPHCIGVDPERRSLLQDTVPAFAVHAVFLFHIRNGFPTVPAAWFCHFREPGPTAVANSLSVPLQYHITDRTLSWK